MSSPITPEERRRSRISSSLEFLTLGSLGGLALDVLVFAHGGHVPTLVVALLIGGAAGLQYLARLRRKMYERLLEDHRKLQANYLTQCVAFDALVRARPGYIKPSMDPSRVEPS